MDERLQIASQLMAAMVTQITTEKHEDFSQFDLSPEQAETLALNAWNMAMALMRVYRDIRKQESSNQFYPGMQYE